MGSCLKAASLRDGIYGQIAFLQIPADGLQADLHQKCLEGITGGFLDDAADVLLAEVDRVRGVGKRGDIIVLLQIVLDPQKLGFGPGQWDGGTAERMTVSPLPSKFAVSRQKQWCRMWFANFGSFK